MATANRGSYARNLLTCHPQEDSDGRGLVIKIWSYAPNDRFRQQQEQEQGRPTAVFIWAKPGRRCIVRCCPAKHCPRHWQNTGLPLVKHKFGRWCKTSRVLATGRHKGNDAAAKNQSDFPRKKSKMELRYKSVRKHGMKGRK